MGRSSLRSSLDRDVYQIIRKIQDDREGNGKLTVPGVYEAIKRSNSSLGRHKKRLLEDSIERVLDFMREESSDSEEEAPEESAKKTDERFLPNRQMTKYWNTPSAAPTVSAEGTNSKKRRLSDDLDIAGSREVKSKAARRANGVSQDVSAAESKAATSTKKPSRATSYLADPPQNLPRIGGLTETRKQLGQLVWSHLRAPDERFRSSKNRCPSGVLLSGLPGVGKRLVVQFRAAKDRIPLISLSDCLRGAQSAPDRLEKMMNEAFEEAKKLAPAIIFIKDVHRHLGKQGANQNDVERRAVIHLEACMDDLRKWQVGNKQVILIGTTNKIESIEAALLTSGVFDKVITVTAPDQKERKEILQLLSQDLDPEVGWDYDSLARLSHGFVGRDLALAVDEASYRKWNRQLSKQDKQAEALLGSRPPELDKADDDDYRAWYTAHPSYVPPDEEEFVEQDLREAIAQHVPYMRREGFTSIPSTTWDDVGALHEIRRQLGLSIIEPCKNPLLFERLKLDRPAGVLLWGPPGCGKTLVAKAVANAAQTSFILINGPELLNKYVGESERAIRELFGRARSCAPCLLFFDEIDSLVPNRQSTSTEAGARVVNALLTEMDGAVSRSGVYVIGTTNRPDMIDAAMLRPGRFDRILFVDLPTEDERVEILKTICRGAESVPDIATVEPVARDRRCDGFSGADLAALFRAASEQVVERLIAAPETASTIITAADWEHALSTVGASVQDPGAYRKLLPAMRRNKG